MKAYASKATILGKILETGLIHKIFIKYITIKFQNTEGAFILKEIT